MGNIVSRRWYSPPPYVYSRILRNRWRDETN